MASTGRRSEEQTESSYDRDPSSYHQYQRHRHPPQQHINQIHNPYSQPLSSHNPPYSHEHHINGNMQMQMALPLRRRLAPPVSPHHQNGNAIGNNNNNNNNNYGNYNNTNNIAVPVPPRMRMRKWSDMTRTIWHYERIEQIGEGTYGQVYRARCKDTNEIVAMKKIRVHHGAHWGMPPTVIREIKILKRLVHPNLVRMYEVVSSKGVEHLDADDYHKGSDRSRKNKKHKSGGGQGGVENSNNRDRDGNNDSIKNDNNKSSTSKQIDVSDAREGYKGNLFLVLEYLPHDLTGLLDVAYRFSEVEIKCIFRQLLEALRYMHDQKYVHRDIKSSNILIDRNFRLKLADFGLARSIEPPLLDNLHERGNSQEFTNKVITLWYRPPELLLGATRYGFAVDIWSAGCILAELVLGRPLFTGKTEMDQLQLIFDMVGTPTSKSWPSIKDLKLLRTGDVSIDDDTNRKRPKLRERYETKMNSNAPLAINLVEKLLELDPSKRPTASRALENRYFLLEPQAPDQPEALGELKLAEGGSFHEFQTKKKRKEAKAEAEKIKQAALDGGQTSKRAQEEYDACYRAIMAKIAREGLESSAATAATTGSNTTNVNEADVKSGEGECDEVTLDQNDDHHGGKHHRSSRPDRSSSDKDKDRYRESRGRDRRSRDRERSGGGNSSRHGNDKRSGEKGGHEKNKDETFCGTHRDRDYDRDRSRERSRSSRRTLESEDRRSKRRRDFSGEDTERSINNRRDKDKERRRENRQESEEATDGNAIVINTKSENRAERNDSTSGMNKEEKLRSDGIGADDKSSRKQSVQNNDTSKHDDSVDTNIDNKSKTVPTDTLESHQEKGDKELSRDDRYGTNQPDEKKDDKAKDPENEHRSRSLNSSGEKKRSERSSYRVRDDDDRRDRRDRDHRRRSSKDKDGRSRDGDRERSSSGRSSSGKRRKSSRTGSRSRSIERNESSRKNRDDRDHHHIRERDHHLRRDRDRDRDRRFHHDDVREMDRFSREDRYLHHDDLGLGLGGSRGPPPPGMQRRGGNPEFSSGPPHHRPDHHSWGGDFGPYGSDRGPPPRGESHGGGGFHGPPGRHSGWGGPSHGNGRPPMDYYPPTGDQRPPFFRDRERSRRRDRDGR